MGSRDAAGRGALSLYLAWTLRLMPVQAVGSCCAAVGSATLPALLPPLVLPHPRASACARSVCRPPKRPVLFASNHISYPDITVLGSLIPGSFIAKAEVAHWPFFGWLAKLQRSVFVDRQVRSTARQRDAIAERLATGDALILFPEGTSGDGNRVLPFKSALFSVARNRERAAPITVQPVSIAYTRLDGMPIGRRLRPFFAWYGDDAIWRRICGGCSGSARSRWWSSSTRRRRLADCGSRKALAGYCHARIAGGRRRAPIRPAAAGARAAAVAASPTIAGPAAG